MGGIIRKVFGGETDTQKAAKQQARADAQRADASAKLKKEEAATALEKSKKKRRTIGRRGSILTGFPLGIQDEAANQKLG